MEKIGKVIHYYDSARFAVIKVERGEFKIGDTIIIQDETDEARTVEQIVGIMQLDIDRTQHEVARAGEEVRVRVEQRAQEGDAVYKK
jgi:translation elongation factor EF-1alpha